jgi:hypothetical protein
MFVNPRPYRPSVELTGALDRGELSFAVTLAAEVTEDQQGPIDLGTALRFLPLVATQQPDHYSAWAPRSLSRWINETPGATIEAAAEVGAQLADLPAEPMALDTIRHFSSTA